MKRNALAVIAVLNFIGVLAITFLTQEKVFAYIVLALAIPLFIQGISSSKPLILVGSLFNFMGIVAGGLVDVKPVLYMAVIGSQFLLVGYAVEVLARKKS